MGPYGIDGVNVGLELSGVVFALDKPVLEKVLVEAVC
jgi:hypothetical protein